MSKLIQREYTQIMMVCFYWHLLTGLERERCFAKTAPGNSTPSLFCESSRRGDRGGGKGRGRIVAIASHVKIRRTAEGQFSSSRIALASQIVAIVCFVHCILVLL